MRSFTSIVLFAASAAAAGLRVLNNCEGSVYITRTDGSGSSPSQQTLAPGVGFATGPIEGAGNSLGISTNSDFYSANTPKLILGTTTDNTTLYWSISSVDGNPFESTGFTLDSPDFDGNDVCGTADSPDGNTRGCPEGSFTLSLDLCTA